MGELGSTKEEDKSEIDLKISASLEKEVSILFDKNKKQYSIKIPKEVVQLFKIKKKDKFRFIVDLSEGQKEIIPRFEIVKNATKEKKKK